MGRLFEKFPCGYERNLKSLNIDGKSIEQVWDKGCPIHAKKCIKPR